MKNIIITVFGWLFLNSCASIIGNHTQLIPISSSPSGANILIINKNGTKIHIGKTPANIVFEKNNSSYWGGGKFIVKIYKKEYEPQYIPIVTKVNNLYTVR